MTSFQSKKVLLLDMDDVIVDQTLTWIQRLYEKTGVLYHRESLTKWDLTSVLPREAAKMIYEEINREPGFFRQLPAKEGAIESIEQLSLYYDIVFVSAGEHYAYRDKYLWLEENLPYLGKPNLVLTHRKDLVMGDILVDDGPHNIIKSPAKLKIIFDHPWNRHLQDYIRVLDWKQLTRILLAKDNRILRRYTG